MRVNDLTGQRFGMLTVVERAAGTGTARWTCRCDCGNVKDVFGSNLRSGRTKSCGCTKTIHGDASSTLYFAYNHMRDSGVVPEWADYASFKPWAMERGYVKGARFRRIDPTQPFGPENCEIKLKS